MLSGRGRAPPAQRALRRVVVTGVGCVSPLGGTTKTTWAGVPGAGASNAQRVAFRGAEYLAAPVCEGVEVPCGRAIRAGSSASRWRRQRGRPWRTRTPAASAATRRGAP